MELWEVQGRDPQVIQRTQKQLNAKQSTIESYEDKVNALENQLTALQQNRGLKLQQATNKIRASKLKMQADTKLKYKIFLILPKFDLTQ